MEQLERLQNVLIEILKVTYETLSSYNIKPFLVGGSCIGALRHGGIIPWDDDVDVALLREDYEKAREILINNLPKGYMFVDNRVDSKYPYEFGKIKKNNTAFVHAADAHLPIHHGIYIDLFPVDNCPDDDTDLSKLIKKVDVYRNLYCWNLMSIRKGEEYRPVWQWPLICISHLFNTKWLENKLEELFTCNNNEETKRVMFFGGGNWKKAIYDRELLSEVKEVEFSGIKAYIPVGYHQYLTQIFGDYMKLPPESQRRSFHQPFYISFSENYYPNNKSTTK